MAHVLVVDDNAQFRNLVRLMLQELGHECSDIATGAGALLRLSRGDVDMAMVDLFMPEMDGLELTKQIRAQFPGLPVIATSGGGNMRMTNLLDWARDMGATITIAKPFDAPQLGRVMKIVQARLRAV
jgi:two-component system OmpR family response regulator